MRLLGLCFVAASLSWCAQVDGLVGENGIAPAGEWLERVQKHAASEGWSDSERFFKVPTGFWDDASGSAQKTVAGVCVVASLLVLLNVAEGWALLVAWFGMLSLMTVGQIFSGYQWDGLLLEAGFVGLFCAHWSRLRPSLAEDRGEFRVSLWAVRALLAKLMFLSGWVKLHSGDLTWLNMTALEYHYWTQPIPASTSWSVHHLPQWFHGVGAWLTVGIELVLPIFVMVGPRRLRVVAAMAFVGVMGAIAMTGNYGFFNLLTVVLCVACLDDQTLDALVPRRWRPSPTPYVHPSRRRRWVVSGLWLATGALVLLSMGRVWMAVDPKGTPQTVVEAQQAVGGLRISNHYGLFARMTLDRPEIMVEGSNDGVAWTPYVFNHKPGPLDRSPSFIGLHMPRLDWQMWFAALRGSCQHARWYLGFVRRLLQGEEAVIRLLSHNPFPEEPPKYIRSRLQHYTFTTPHERAQTGAIWHAEERRPFCPTLQLSPQGRLVRARLTPSSGSQSL